MAGRVTIKSIAQDLGISHMTVSRALSNHPSVRAETRRAILKRATELGYVRNAAATAMRGDATGIVGLLVPTLTNEFYARYANAFALACESHDLQAITHLTNDDSEREAAALLRLREVQADGVVLVPAPGTHEVETGMLFGGMNVVQLIRHREDIGAGNGLIIEDAEPIAAAVDHLAERGHRRIGYIGSHEELSSGRQRLEAFRQGMARNGLLLRSDLIRTAPPSFEAGQDGLVALLEADEPATALICGGFELSNGALEACLRHGLILPDDLAFVGYGDPAFYEWIQGGISTIALPVEALAGLTVELLLQGRASAEPSLAVPANLVIRNSSNGVPS